MRKNVLLLMFMILAFIPAFAETVEYGFLKFEIPGSMVEAEPLYPSGFALKNGTLDPNSGHVGEGLYLSVSISDTIGKDYLPQWESEAVCDFSVKEKISVDGLEAWCYTGVMPPDDSVWFMIIYFPLSELSTENEMLFILMVNGENETQWKEAVKGIVNSVKVKRPEISGTVSNEGASISLPDGEDGIYEPGEAIRLNYSIDEKYIPLSPWICIVPSYIEHGSSDNNDLYDTYYAFLPSPTGEVTLWLPDVPGTYDFRINSSYFEGVELVYFTFEVTEKEKATP